MRELALMIVLVTCTGPAGASVITSGDMVPSKTGTQPDPWVIAKPWAGGGNLYVGITGTGTLNVENGGSV